MSNLPLSQEYNALRGRPQQQPDWASFGKAVAEILRGVLRTAATFDRLDDAARAHGIDLGGGEK